MLPYLLPKGLAKKGYSFKFLGITEECESCDMVRICSSLTPGVSYEVLEVREVEHNCPIQGRVKVVFVREAPIYLSMEKRVALEGAIMEFESIGCSDCKNSEFCSPEEVKGRVKIRVEEVIRPIKCPKSIELVLAKVTVLERLPER